MKKIFKFVPYRNFFYSIPFLELQNFFEKWDILSLTKAS
jgi:hypothetical protein